VDAILNGDVAKWKKLFGNQSARASRRVNPVVRIYTTEGNYYP
jgi:hypothetical protein